MLSFRVSVIEVQRRRERETWERGRCRTTWQGIQARPSTVEQRKKRRIELAFVPS